MKLLITLSLLLTGLWTGPTALEPYELASSTTLSVEGTSTLHDWEMVAEELKGRASITLDESGTPDVQGLTVSVQAESLKSHHKGMDKNAYEALKTDEHPRIRFELTRMNSAQKSGEAYAINASGKLTIAGTTRPISMSVNCKTEAGGSLKFEGRSRINMKDYGIDPPTAMLGTIKTGEVVTVVYRAVFQPKDLTR